MGGSYVVYDEVDPGYVDSGGASASGQRRKRRRKFYNNVFDSIQDVLAEEAQRVEALPMPPKPTPKRKKHVARQIVIAAGKYDLLPVIAEHEEKAIELGAEAIEAIKKPLADAQAQTRIIADMIADLERLADEEDEAGVERLLAEYDQRQYAAIAKILARFA